jgi:hypothetical protein
MRSGSARLKASNNRGDALSQSWIEKILCSRKRKRTNGSRSGLRANSITSGISVGILPARTGMIFETGFNATTWVTASYERNGLSAVCGAKRRANFFTDC